MKITRLEKILLGLALGVAISTGAQAADSTSYTYEDNKVTITWDDYAGKVTGTTATSFEYTYGETTTNTVTFTDENGNTISFNTATVGEAGTGSTNFNLASTLGNGTSATEKETATTTVTINETEYTFTVNYSKDNLTNKNDSGMSNPTGDVSGVYFEGISDSFSDSIEHAAAIYNTGTNVGTITAGFIKNGINNDTYTDNGAAIYNSGTIGKIDGSYFIENFESTTNNAYGAAIDNVGTITSGISGSYFIGNNISTSAEEGSIYAEGGAIFNSGSITGGISESYFIGNTASTTGTTAYGGAIYNVVLNGSDGTIGDITGSYFIGNSATGSTAHGGAIYNNGGTIGKIEKSYFVGNSAANQGGAIYSNGGTIGSISESYFVGNNSGSSGGVILLSGTTTVEGITGSYFVANTASGSGAVLNINSASTVKGITGSYFLGNASTGSNGGAITNAGTITIGGTGTYDAVYFENNTANAAGGAIANSGNMTITGSYFVENDAANGGAIFNSATNSKTVTITDSYFLSNVASNTNGRGAAIYNDNDSYITSIKGSYFIGNEAMSYAGAIYNQAGASIGSIEDCYFIENKSLAETGSGKGNGGALENAWGTASIGSITRSYFIANEAVGETSDQTYNGGAIYNEGLIGTSEGEGGISESEFVANLATRGGAIYNADGALSDGTATTANITSITGSKFLGNTAILFGGAIYNGDGCTIGEISSNYFVDNQAQGGNGGAVENAWGASFIGDMDSNVFIGNKAEDGHSGAAIYNEGLIGIDASGETTGGISNSTFLENEASLYGGAIYNTSNTELNTTATITYVKGSTFEGNTATSGGAIYNAEDCEIGEISGNSFTSNAAISTDGYAMGGAIYNAGTIGTFSIAKDITGNYATGSTGAYGGAIFDTNSTITITGAVSGNSVTASGGVAAGGAIYYGVADSASFLATDTDSPTITISGDVTGNTATGTTAYGGAIYNDGGTVTLTGNITGNTATGTTAAYGGAIYNDSGIVNIDLADGQVITNNTASSDGGAIYNAGTGVVNISVSGEVVISGNTADGEANFLYGEADSVTNFNLADGSTLEVDDSIEGDKGYAVNVVGDSVDTTTFYMFDDFLDSSLSFSGTTLNTIDGVVKTYSVDKFTVAGDFNMVADVDLENEEMDRFVTNGNSYGTAGGTLTVSGMNLLSDATEDGRNNGVAVYFAETGLMKDVVSGISGLPDSYQLTAFTPIYSYDVYYLYSENGTVYYNGEEVGTAADSDLISDDGGYFAFAVSGTDPWTKTEDENPGSGDDDDDDDGNGGDGGGSGDGGDGGDDGGDKGGDTGSGDTGDTGTDDTGDTGTGDTGSDTGSGNTGSHDRLENYNPAVLAPEVAMAGAYGAMNLMFEYNFEHSDYYMKLPEAVRFAQHDEDPVESDATKPAYYNRHELTETGAWMRAFTSNESVDYGSGFKSRDKYYGAMFGVDTKVHEHDNGWASVFTGYAGSMGIRQTYSGGHIKQHGGFIGATASFYKKNFYTAWTIAAGTTKAHEHTMYGHDKERLDTYGIAGRIGYNIKLGDEGKFSLLPTFTASYTYVNPEDFTNAAGVKFDSNGFSAVQLNPNLKFIWNRDDGWQPYLTVGEVWTVGESSHVKATWSGQRHNLVPLDLDNYTEYGVGIQKRWADERDAYVQVLGHSHGRDGILINAGIRWNF